LEKIQVPHRAVLEEAGFLELSTLQLENPGSKAPVEIVKPERNITIVIVVGFAVIIYDSNNNYYYCFCFCCYNSILL
jgi:hypothetical protein